MQESCAEISTVNGLLIPQIVSFTTCCLGVQEIPGIGRAYSGSWLGTICRVFLPQMSLNQSDGEQMLAGEFDGFVDFDDRVNSSD
ncbi:MAG: hypothetical protein CMJ78_27110 [Planctomycetaceae bacterium]|nr:hypothetical protein [Planctomycetaceae bacterium]